jgi:menaquinone-dependent protoporphyrinogen oxidase
MAKVDRTSPGALAVASSATAPEVLVVYASTHGHTATIANRVSDILQQEGLRCHTERLSRGGAARAGDFDAVVLGASVHVSRHQRVVIQWARDQHVALNSRPSAFFSVCLTAVEQTDKARDKTAAWIADVRRSTGWIPTRTVSIAGALQFRRYGLVLGLLMRLIALRIERGSGIPVDVREDTDFTDWAAVERFARDFARTVQAAHAA